MQPNVDKNPGIKQFIQKMHKNMCNLTTENDRWFYALICRVISVRSRSMIRFSSREI